MSYYAMAISINDSIHQAKVAGSARPAADTLTNINKNFASSTTPPHISLRIIHKKGDMTSKKPIMSRLFSRQIPPINLRLSLPPLHGHQLEHGFEAVVPEGGDEAHIERSGVILGDELHRCGRGDTATGINPTSSRDSLRGTVAFGKGPFGECGPALSREMRTALRAMRTGRHASSAPLNRAFGEAQTVLPEVTFNCESK